MKNWSVIRICIICGTMMRNNWDSVFGIRERKLSFWKAEGHIRVVAYGYAVYEYKDGNPVENDVSALRTLYYWILACASMTRVL